MSCIFCKILDGNAPASFIYRDQDISVFLDVNPMTEGHFLVVPNKHVERFYDLDEAVAGKISGIGSRIYKALKSSGLKTEGANVFLSDGSIAGQEVPHVHLHIVPRFPGDGYRRGDRARPSRVRLDELAKLIAAHL